MALFLLVSLSSHCSLTRKNTTLNNNTSTSSSDEHIHKTMSNGANKTE